jgi:hypothetical protein
MNKRASRAILLPKVADNSTEAAAQAPKARARSIADRLCVLLELANELSERDFDGVVVACTINQTAAMVAYRV